MLRSLCVPFFWQSDHGTEFKNLVKQEFAALLNVKEQMAVEPEDVKALALPTEISTELKKQQALGSRRSSLAFTRKLEEMQTRTDAECFYCEGASQRSTPCE